jgi:hypothetical protein
MALAGAASIAESILKLSRCSLFQIARRPAQVIQSRFQLADDRCIVVQLDPLKAPPLHATDGNLSGAAPGRVDDDPNYP